MPWRWQGAVVTHQTLNELTNLYFETLYLGLPLIHNSPMLEDYGYYYNDFDLEKGYTTGILYYFTKKI